MLDACRGRGVRRRPAASTTTRDVRPILAANCFGCHGPRQQQSGLRLDLRQNALRGGDYGVVIVPGNAADSKLIKRLIGSEAGLQMPPTGPLRSMKSTCCARGSMRAPRCRAARRSGRRRSARPVAAMQRLIDAIAAQDLAAVKTLLAADTDPREVVGRRRIDALMHGAASGTVAIMQALIDAGADVNAKNTRSATALHWAVADEAKVKLLLLSGAAVDAKTVEGRTPLYAAATTAGAARRDAPPARSGRRRQCRDAGRRDAVVPGGQCQRRGDEAAAG